MKRVLDIPVETRRAASPAIGKNVAAFRRAVLGWYDQHRRDLPWRKTRDPYRIWLSEIMLQQTRVAAVLEHYRVFLERFPNVEVLAAASEDAVLAAWSGLGYYRRARMLHRCARQIARQHGGCFPRDSEALLALPGIGRYTAAAIASIAFSEPVAVVDGNVERVLQRLIGNKSIGINLTTAQTWQHAQALLAQLPARGFQSGHDGTRRNRVRAARAPLPNVPGAEMVCHAGRSSARRAAFPSEKETNLVRPGVARRQRQ